MLSDGNADRHILSKKTWTVFEESTFVVILFVLTRSRDNYFMQSMDVSKDRYLDSKEGLFHFACSIYRNFFSIELMRVYQQVREQDA